MRTRLAFATVALLSINSVGSVKDVGLEYEGMVQKKGLPSQCELLNTVLYKDFEDAFLAQPFVLARAFVG